MMNDKVIEKIQKLLALATSSNEHEARLAAERANELLLKHNLTMQKVENHESEYDQMVVEQTETATQHSKWVMVLLKKHFFVTPIKSRSKLAKCTRWILVGEKTNLQIAYYVHGFLNQAFKRLWNDYKKEHDLRNSSMSSYYAGLFKGLDEQFQNRKTTVENEMGLVVVGDPNLPQKVRSLIGETGNEKIRGGQMSDKSAIAAGEQAGRALHIRRGIESKATNSQKYLGNK